jgi:hypothetical protein
MLSKLVNIPSRLQRPSTSRTVVPSHSIDVFSTKRVVRASLSERSPAAECAGGSWMAVPAGVDPAGLHVELSHVDAMCVGTPGLLRPPRGRLGGGRRCPCGRAGRAEGRRSIRGDTSGLRPGRVEVRAGGDAGRGAARECLVAMVLPAPAVSARPGGGPTPRGLREPRATHGWGGCGRRQAVGAARAVAPPLAPASGRLRSPVHRRPWVVALAHRLDQVARLEPAVPSP